VPSGRFARRLTSFLPDRVDEALRDPRRLDNEIAEALAKLAEFRIRDADVWVGHAARFRA
jgi:hypothetical protein